MPGTVRSHRSPARQKSDRGSEESPLARGFLIAVALVFAFAFLLLPLVNVFAQALGHGWNLYWKSIVDPNTLSAIRLTLLVAVICVPLNALFGLAAAWAIAKFQFRGKALLTALIDLPF